MSDDDRDLAKLGAHWTDFLSLDDVDLFDYYGGGACQAIDPETEYACSADTADHGLRHLAGDGEHIVAIWPLDDAERPHPFTD